MSVSGDAEFRREIAEADGFIGSPTPELMRIGKKLKWVQVGSAGVDNIRFPELIRSDVTCIVSGSAEPGRRGHQPPQRGGGVRRRSLNK